MPTYQYVAVDQKGAKRKGKIEAPDTSRAERTLKLEGLIPIQVKETMFAENVSLGGKSVKPRTMAVFCRQMVSLLNAGVSIVDAFGMLADQCDNKIMQAALRDVMSNVAKGENLARSLKEHPNVFSPMMINMVDAGEASGSLENSFDRLAIQFEKDARLKATIKKALVYPIVVLIVAVAVVIVMLNFVIPQFSDMFKDLDTELPTLTKVVVAMSDWMKENVIILIAVIVIIVIAWRVFASSPTGQVVIGRTSMKLPLIGSVITKSAAARFARTMSTLLSAGISIVDALEITSKNMPNVLYKDALLYAKDEVEKGVQMSDPLRKSGLFPIMICHMTKIGEDTGNIEEMLDRCAGYFEEEVETAVAGLMTAMEPMIIILLAGVVGVLIGACLMPMLTLYESLSEMM
ncbi:MAG: type II secretion system F family protein [Lachnospiraceae bacterium]|nr:type II secretion system F family protein [Lachnospiraceae bacterium]